MTKDLDNVSGTDPAIWHAGYRCLIEGGDLMETSNSYDDKEGLLVEIVDKEGSAYIRKQRPVIISRLPFKIASALRVT